MNASTLLIIGAFDTKGSEYAYVIDLLRQQGIQLLTMNIGTMGSTDLFKVDIEAEQIAEAAGEELAQIRAANDRGRAMQVMGEGASIRVKALYDAGKIQGIFGMGGTGGSSVITKAMRSLPLGVPKVCVSTAAGSDTSSYVGTRDVVMFPSITDVAGVNRISKVIFRQAVGAISGMMRMEAPESKEDQPIILASMFGNTTTCVNQCMTYLDKAGYEVLVFHAVGSGGRTLEDLAEHGLAAAVLDITTTEWADEICEGIFTAGKDRLSGPGRAAVPHLIVPGCIDMVNYGGIDSIPMKYRDRTLYPWNPNVTLMRTTAEENAQLGKIFAEKANAAMGPVGFLIPTQGFSILDSKSTDGTPDRFWDPEADQAFISSLKQHLRADIPVVEMDANINDEAFSRKAVDLLLNMIG
ncbi:MAG: Tm-1-like ATP-binding domain-containing protein [Bacteroidota bacterium]